MAYWRYIEPWVGAKLIGCPDRPSAPPTPLRRCNSGKALLIGLTRLFCKQQRTSTNAERRTPNAKRRTPNAEREAPGEGQTGDWELMCAGAIVQIQTIMILTFFVQKQIVAGLTLGSVR